MRKIQLDRYYELFNGAKKLEDMPIPYDLALSFLFSSPTREAFITNNGELAISDHTDSNNILFSVKDNCVKLRVMQRIASTIYTSTITVDGGHIVFGESTESPDEMEERSSEIIKKDGERFIKTVDNGHEHLIPIENRFAAKKSDYELLADNSYVAKSVLSCMPQEWASVLPKNDVMVTFKKDFVKVIEKFESSEEVYKAAAQTLILANSLPMTAGSLKLECVEDNKKVGLKYNQSNTSLYCQVEYDGNVIKSSVINNNGKWKCEAVSTEDGERSIDVSEFQYMDTWHAGKGRYIISHTHNGESRSVPSPVRDNNDLLNITTIPYVGKNVVNEINCTINEICEGPQFVSER
ncbi:MAG: hypothetical protein J6X00_01635 [Clostridia bacterium]|nr:hypothetical protein [Clostridia bacterium]